MVRTPGFHPEDPGSIPHAGDFFLNFNSDTYFQSSANSLSAAYYSFQHSVTFDSNPNRILICVQNVYVKNHFF